MVPRLWVPDCHRLEARNWNLAASGAAFTASRVANSIDVSTPLRTGLSVMVMSLVLSGGVSGDGAVGGAVRNWSGRAVGIRRRWPLARRPAAEGVRPATSPPRRA